MLYLAEVKKQTKFIGSPETKLKLLACKQNDQSWSPVRGSQPILVQEASDFGDGALVIVSLTGNKRVQGKPQLAGARLVKELQDFSRLLEKSRESEEEIEQWKQSLTYQSQELTRREMDIEARSEELELKEKELQTLNQKREEIHHELAELEQRKQELSRKSEELELAQNHLQGEQQDLKKKLVKLSEQTTVLDEEQVDKIQQLMAQLSSAILPTDYLQEQISWAKEQLNHEQANCDHRQDMLKQQRANFTRQQEEFKQQGETLIRRKQDLEAQIASLQQEKTELLVGQNNLKNKQELAQKIALNIEEINSIYEMINSLAVSSGDINLEGKLDIGALENMPLGELEQKMENLRQELVLDVQFVRDQEEELMLQLQVIDELKQKIKAATPYDSLGWEAELSEEQDGYKMLERSLMGSRRALRKREAILKQHMRVFRSRTGIFDLDAEDNQINFQPVLQQLETQKQRLHEELQQLATEIELLQSSISENEERLQQQSLQTDAKQQELLREEESWQQAKVSIALLQYQVNSEEKVLSRNLESLNFYGQQLQYLEQFLAQLTENKANQEEALKEMQLTMTAIM